MKHFASRRFWQCFENLPANVQRLAKRNFDLLKQNPAHPSLHFKELGGNRYRSVRIGLHYRALGVPVADGIQWFWIGTHEDYNKLVS
ncbi:MAG: hypothetical protein ACRER1_03815 [Gammaproteobacteria bacterium]